MHFVFLWWIPVHLDVVDSLAFSPYTVGPITMDHENTIRGFAEQAWKRSFIAGTRLARSSLGALDSHGSPSTSWSISTAKISQCVHASDFYPQPAVGATDGTTNTLRRTGSRGTIVCISLRNFVKKLWHCFKKQFIVYKVFQIIIIEMPRNIECLMVFCLEYAPIFLHFGPPR